MKFAAVVLAAGASTRLGQPKQNVQVGGETLLERAVRACFEAELDPVVVVLGANAEAIRTSSRLNEARVIENPDWEEGMASSVRLGIAALSPEEADAAVLLTCDMPFVTGHHLSELMTLAGQSGRSVASQYEGKRGVPACLVREDFSMLMSLRGDVGAGSLLVAAPYVELADSSDVDTVEQLEQARVRAASDTR